MKAVDKMKKSEYKPVSNTHSSHTANTQPVLKYRWVGVNNCIPAFNLFIIKDECNCSHGPEPHLLIAIIRKGRTSHVCLT